MYTRANDTTPASAIGAGATGGGQERQGRGGERRRDRGVTRREAEVPLVLSADPDVTEDPSRSLASDDLLHALRDGPGDDTGRDDREGQATPPTEGGDGGERRGGPHRSVLHRRPEHRVGAGGRSFAARKTPCSVSGRPRRAIARSRPRRPCPRADRARRVRGRTSVGLSLARDPLHGLLAAPGGSAPGPVSRGRAERGKFRARRYRDVADEPVGSLRRPGPARRLA